MSGSESGGFSRSVWESWAKEKPSNPKSSTPRTNPRSGGSDEEAVQQSCRSCRKDANVFCLDCESSFCKNCCSRVHFPGVQGSPAAQGLGPLSRHRIVALNPNSSTSSPSVQVRLCASHDWEKLTLYSSRARRFGCVKCFQEGNLRGHQGQSLQRAVTEVKEKVQRQHGGLEKQAKKLKDSQKLIAKNSELVGESRAQLQSAVTETVIELHKSVDRKQDQLLLQVEEWHKDKQQAAQNLLAPVQTGLKEIEEEIEMLKAICLEEEDEAFLEAVYSSDPSTLKAEDSIRDLAFEEETFAELQSVPKVDISQAHKLCSGMGFSDEGPGGERAQREGEGSQMTDAMELDRVAVIALSNEDIVQLSAEDRRLFWKHRITLTDNKRALLKLLKCAQWDKERQVRQLLELVPRWVDVVYEDALEMLAADYNFGPIRALAVRSIQSIPDADLICFLMPLAIALRHDVPEDPHLWNFLLQRAKSNPKIAIGLYWYIVVEKSAGGVHSKLYADMLTLLVKELQTAETELHTNGPKLHEVLRRQDSFVTAIHGLMAEATRYRETRPKQIERLMSVLAEGGSFSHLTALGTPVNLPHQPHISISGIMPANSTILKSAMNPIKLVLKTTDDKTHTILMKSSNDLRRDQLILNCIDMMDALLQREGVDLKITTYKVTATSHDTGLVEWVENCFPLSTVLAEYDNDIRNFFKKYATDENAQETILDNFVKSCAGYCVISYLLGIGDRHLDNLMLSTNGCLFHVDFEYILGNDPKPFAPPMKLSEQMVVAMGGRGSRDYLEFHKYCCKAYLILRKSARLFVALFNLMGDLNLSGKSGVSNGQVIAQRFRMDLSREEAVQYMQTIIQESLGAIFPQVVDVVHRWRLYFKT